jgi:hypothetical protein
LFVLTVLTYDHYLFQPKVSSACSLDSVSTPSFPVSSSISSYLCTSPFHRSGSRPWHISTPYGLVSFLHTHTTHTASTIGLLGPLFIRHYTYITFILRPNIQYGTTAYHPTHSFHHPHSLISLSHLSPYLLSPRICSLGRACTITLSHIKCYVQLSISH